VASAGARAYNGDLGSRGRAPSGGSGTRGEAALKITCFLCLKHYFINASAIVLVEMAYCLSRYCTGPHPGWTERGGTVLPRFPPSISSFLENTKCL